MKPIEHLFHKKEWRFKDEIWRTENAILDYLPYNPEILILGTFNPTQPNNIADFFMVEIYLAYYI
jgi:hypothetical protein